MSAEKTVNMLAAKAAERIVLDVGKELKRVIEIKDNSFAGGKKFATSRSTLLSQKGSVFEAMMLSETWNPNSDGE